MDELVQIPLDPYCSSSCRELRCDANHDCRMLKFRRNTEVRERLPLVVQYVETRHAPVGQSDLVRRFFFDEHRRSLREDSQHYLESEFGRLLGDALRRDGRCERRQTGTATPAWANRGAPLSEPVPASRSDRCTTSDELSSVASAITAADRPIALWDHCVTEGIKISEAAAKEARLSAALSTIPQLRCVAIDRSRGVGTHWTSTEWLSCRLPSCYGLQPIPTELFRPCKVAAEEDGGDQPLPLEMEEDEDDSASATTIYVTRVDDVLAGSLMLETGDLYLFPQVPNPAWVELRDPDGGIHDGLLLRRGAEVELFGLGDFLLEVGVGVQLCLRPAGRPNAMLLERLAANHATNNAPVGEERLPRRIWREMLQRRTSSLRTLSDAVGASEERVRAVLEQYRCFEFISTPAPVWVFDCSQPRLLPRVAATALDIGLAESLIADARAILATLHQLRDEVFALGDEAERVLGGFR